MFRERLSRPYRVYSISSTTTRQGPPGGPYPSASGPLDTQRGPNTCWGIWPPAPRCVFSPVIIGLSHISPESCIALFILALPVPLSALILPYIELGLCSRPRQTSAHSFPSTAWRWSYDPTLQVRTGEVSSRQVPG